MPSPTHAHIHTHSHTHTHQVAGVNYRVKAEADGNPVVITAFKGLPHTGGALEVKSVEASHDSF